MRSLRAARIYDADAAAMMGDATAERYEYHSAALDSQREVASFRSMQRVAAMRRLTVALAALGWVSLLGRCARADSSNADAGVLPDAPASSLAPAPATPVAPPSASPKTPSPSGSVPGSTARPHRELNAFPIAGGIATSASDLARSAIGLSPKIDNWLPYSYQQLDAEARFYFIPVQRWLTVTWRVVGDALLGAPPFYELARFDETPAIGGVNAVRDVPAQRYYGKVKLFENFEARSELWPFRIKKKQLIVGVAAFLDAGRVWTEISHANPDLDGMGLGIKYGIGGGLGFRRVRPSSSGWIWLGLPTRPTSAPTSLPGRVSERGMRQPQTWSKGPRACVPVRWIRSV